MPMAGAPRTIMLSMAAAIAAAVSISTYVSVAGRQR